MLDRFLIVGIGGSGGRTLRHLQSDLKSRLASRGWHDDLPTAWQFLHIDTPAFADVSDAGPLGRIRYAGLTMGGEEYAQLDQQIALRGDGALRHYTTWRPDPKLVMVSPEFAAGQYRAVGRVIAMAAGSRLVQELQDTATAVRNADIESLSAASHALGDDQPAGSTRTWVFVISSLAGGSGSGIFLDVCDALRMLEGFDGLGDSLGILFTPDIFRDVKGVAGAGLRPNALASLSELLSAVWNHDAPSANEFSLLTMPGVLVPKDSNTFRGPRRTFLVGLTNSMETQHDIYRVVASALGAIITNRSTQDRIAEVTTGDWDIAGKPSDDSGLTAGETQPFNSIGYGSLSLGRHRFATYGSYRLTGELARHLLTGHRPEGSTDSDVVLLDTVADGYLNVFLGDAGLLEMGPQHNQILDEIRGGAFRSVAEPLSREVRDSILQSATAGLTELIKDAFVALLDRLIPERREQFLAERHKEYESRAAAWVSSVQERTMDALLNSLTVNGGRGTLAVLNAAIRHLDAEIVNQLNAEALALRDRASKSSVPATMKLLANAPKKILSNSAIVRQAVQSNVEGWFCQSEDDLASMAARLVHDYVRGVLEPLSSALESALDGLARDWGGRPGEPSPLPRWASGVVSDDLLPAPYEIILEDASKWQATFEELAKRHVNSEFPDDAVREILAKILREDEHLCRRLSAWSPPSNVLNASGGASRARFVFDIDIRSLLMVCTGYIEKPGTEFSDFIREPLAHWLAPSGQLDKEKLRTFVARMSDMQRIARPLVELDQNVARTLYGGLDTTDFHRILTPIPLDRAHPAFSEIERLLAQDFNYSDTELTAAFKGDGNAIVLDVVSTLRGPVSPLMIKTLTEPIASMFEAHSESRAARAGGDDLWFARRSRPLLNALPVPPHLARAFLRGWFIGRGLGLITIEELSHPKIWVKDQWIPMTSLLGRRPAYSNEVLPAVLEGLGLVLVRLPNEPSSWHPYRALAEFGGWSRDDAYSIPASLVFAEWIDTGQAPTLEKPLAELSGETPLDRAKAMEKWLQELERDYLRLADTVPSTEWQPFDRAWEIAAPIATALGQVRGWLQHWLRSEDSDHGVFG